jgi:hypothetical protein
LLEPLVELVGVLERRLGEDDREFVPADPARDVRGPDDVADAVGRLRQDPVPGEVPDAVVDRLEVVEIEDHEREAAAVALRAGDLAGERLVEVAAVVQPGERVEVGELARLTEPSCVVDGRAGAQRELLELGRRALPERLTADARVGGEIAELLVFAREGHRERRPDRRALPGSSSRVVVFDRDRARRPPVRRAGDRRGRVGGAEAAGRTNRLAFGVDRDDDGVDAAQRSRCLERARQHLVEVDRAAELTEHAAAPVLLLGALERLREVPHHRLHPLVDLLRDGVQLRLGRAAATAAE